MAPPDELPIRAVRGDDNLSARAKAHTTPPPLRRNNSSLRLITELTRERISLRFASRSLRSCPLLTRTSLIQLPAHVDRAVPTSVHRPQCLPCQQRHQSYAGGMSRHRSRCPRTARGATYRRPQGLCDHHVSRDRVRPCRVHQNTTTTVRLHDR
jgi:hypothetical protein